MKEIDHRLGRLLKSAAAAPRDLPDEPPFGFETRVISQWLSESGDELSATVMMFRNALICFLGVMILSLALSYRQLTTPTRNDIAIANSVIELNMP